MDPIAAWVAAARDPALPPQQRHDAFDQLVLRFQDMVIACTYEVVGDFHQAQDLAQETFLCAYLELDTLRQPAALAGWLRQIARRCVPSSSSAPEKGRQATKPRPLTPQPNGQRGRGTRRCTAPSPRCPRLSARPSDSSCGSACKREPNARLPNGWPKYCSKPWSYWQLIAAKRGSRWPMRR